MPTEREELDRLEPLVDTALKSWRRSPDYEDYRSVALMAAWTNRHLPPSHIVQRARAAIVQEYRDLHGRAGTARGDATTVRLVHDPEHLATVTELTPSLELGLDRRTGLVLDCIAQGFPKQDIARALGISPSGVSKLLRRACRTLAG